MDPPRPIMRIAQSIDPLIGPSRTTPKLRLKVGRVFARLFLTTFLFFEFNLVLTIIRRFGKIVPLDHLLNSLVLFSVRGLIACAIIAGVVVFVGALLVRLILRPTMACWYDPRPADASIGGHAPFRLGSSEWVEAEIPARLVAGRRGQAGDLVLTNSKIWFFPWAWDEEPWHAELDGLDHVRIEPSRLSAFGAVRGWPDEIVFHDESGSEARIALADPSTILDWFEESDVPRYLHLNH